MSAITTEQRREYREAREQAISGVARLNSLFTATGRVYRTRLEFYRSPLAPLADQAATLEPDADDIDAVRLPDVPEDEDGI